MTGAARARIFFRVVGPVANNIFSVSSFVKIAKERRNGVVQSHINETADLVVLIRRHGNELCLAERVRPAAAAAVWHHLVTTAESNHVTTRLILPHRVQDYLTTVNKLLRRIAWLGSRMVSVLDSGAEGSDFISRPRRCRVTVLGKLFIPIVPVFTGQRNRQQPS